MLKGKADAACVDEGMSTLGIEPAANIAAMARDKGLEVVNEYFTPETAARAHAQYGPATVITITSPGPR